MLLLALFLLLIHYSKGNTHNFRLTNTQVSDIFLPPDQKPDHKTPSTSLYQLAMSDSISDELRYLNELMGRSSFFGDWFAADGKPVNGLTHTEGFLLMHYESDDEFAFGFEVFDGIYMDQKVLTILYDHSPNISNYDPLTSTIKFNPTTIDYQVGATYGELGTIHTCVVTTSLHLINTTSLKPFKPTRDFAEDLDIIGLEFTIIGKECSIQFSTSPLTNKNALFEAQGNYYFGAVLFIGILQCFVCIIVEKNIDKKESLGRKISPWTLLVLNGFDLYFLLSTVYFFMIYSPIYELAAIPLALLAFLYEPRLAWKVFKIQGKKLDQQRRSRLEIQSYFGMLVLFLSLLISLVIYPNFVYIMTAAYLIPQIKHNFEFSRKHKWNFWVIFGLGFPKVLFAIYSKLDEINLLRITPNPRVVCFFLLVFLVQLLVLAVQVKFPRFGFEGWTPYKIYITNKNGDNSQEICAICLDKIKVSFATGGTPSFIKDCLLKKQKILTPCKHEFHLVCLTEWLKSKLECPYCRTELPALPEEDED